MTKRYSYSKSEPTDLFVIIDELHKETFSGIDDEYNCSRIVRKLNTLTNENKQLKSTIAKLIEENRKNNDLLLSDIKILEKALWCSGCENDYGRLKELRKEFMG